MPRTAARIILSLALLAFAGQAALAGKRVALVIGNAAYTNAPTLANPKNDAEDIAAALKALGFTIILGTDLGKTAMDRKILDFEKALTGADAGVFHYSGHGLQVAGVNYLVPVDASLESAAALRIEAVRLDFIQEIMEHETKTNILFLDACRNNPLARNLARAMGTRSAEIGRGLASMESGAGTLISFSTQPGNVALDGDGRNSPYSGPLVKAIGTQGEDVLSMLTGVRNAVMAATRDKQVPWDNNALRAKFYFNPAAPAEKAEPGTPQAPVSEAAREWGKLENSKDAAVLEAFRKQFGAANPYYDMRAEQRIAALKEGGAAAPPKPAEDACEDGLLVSVAVGKKPCIKPGSGEFFKDCPDCPEMVVVPAGHFTMGSPENEPEHRSNETQHEVRFAKPFAVGRFAVTFAEWDACVAGDGCDGYRPDDRGWGRDGRPVIIVNWNRAKSYVQWLSAKTGRQYRLLSEAEREYAGRAGTVTPFWWGASISTGQANYNGNYNYTYNGGSKGEYRQKTLTVKSFKPNPWGLYQVHGNVSDWVEDCYHDNYHNAPADGSAWTTGECKYRVLRGGSWNNLPRVLRAAFRHYGPPDGRGDDIGFRVGLGWQDLNR